MITLNQLSYIIKLAVKPMYMLRKINGNDDRAYKGITLTKTQLIFQIVFKRDAPDPDDEQGICATCGDVTKTTFNIDLKAVHVCENCAQRIFLQQATWYAKQK